MEQGIEEAFVELHLKPGSPVENYQKMGMVGLGMSLAEFRILKPNDADCW